jgi:hypothetical protein
MKIAFDGQAAADAYTRAFRRLHELPGFDPVAGLKAEAGSILKAWAGRTKVADQASTMKRARLAATKALGLARFESQAHAVTITAGIRGDAGAIWLRTRRKIPQHVGHVDVMGSGVRFRHRHVHSDDWAAIVASVNAYRTSYPKALKSALRSVGLSRQSVIQIADDLGIDLNAVKGQGIGAAGIAKARAAIASNGRVYKNGTGTSGGDKVKSYVELINRLPHGIKIGMDRTLAGVLSGRAKFIETAYQKGAFDSVRSAAKAFPNLLKLEKL